MRGKALLVDVPGIARGAPLLPEPVEVAAQVDRDEEQLRLIRVLCPHLALEQVLVQQLQGQLRSSADGTQAARAAVDARDARVDANRTGAFPGNYSA